MKARKKRRKRNRRRFYDLDNFFVMAGRERRKHRRRTIPAGPGKGAMVDILREEAHDRGNRNHP